MSETVKTTKKNFLEKRIVRVRPIPANQKWATLTSDPVDPNLGYMFDGIKRSLPLPKNKNNEQLYVKVLDDTSEYDTTHGVCTEKQFFEREIGKNLDFNTSNDFWNKFRVPLEKSGITLDLSNPMHYLYYSVLKNAPRHISPNAESINNRSTYWFYLEDEGDSINLEKQRMDLEDEANELWIGMKNSESKLMDFLRVIGKRIPKNYKEDFLQTEVNKVKREDPEKFLSILKDSNFKEKAFVRNAISSGAITKVSGGYMITGNDIDIFKNESDLIVYLTDPENSDIKARIQGQIKKK